MQEMDFVLMRCVNCLIMSLNNHRYSEIIQKLPQDSKNDRRCNQSNTCYICISFVVTYNLYYVIGKYKQLDN